MIDRLHEVVSETTPARPVAVARIAVAASALLKAALMWPLLFALRDPTVLRVPMTAWVPLLPGNAVPLLMTTWLFAGLAFLLGWRTRIAGAVLTLVLFCTLLGDQQLYSNHLYLAAVVTGLLTLADSGAALSLDAVHRGEQPRVRAWPVTLLKVQLSVVYAFAAVTKLNPVYVSGAILNAYAGRGSVLAIPEAARRWEVMAPLAVLSILVEVFLALAFWSKRWRPAAFGLGFAFHGAIVLSMVPTGEMIVFSVLIFSLYLLFLDGRVDSRRVIWDDGSATWRKWVPRLQLLDWLRVHRFVRESSAASCWSEAPRSGSVADETIRLIGPVDRSPAIDALRTILERLPVSFLWAPYLRISLIRRMGTRIMKILP